MKKIHLVFINSRAWLMAALIILGIMFGYWVSGTWPSNPSFEYVPPRFDELQVTQGKLSFTRRSKSSGGEIELQLENGNKLRLACNAPNSLPSDCSYRRMNGKQYGESFRSFLTGKVVTVWWKTEEDLTKGGRVYQMRVENELFFSYQEQVDYYVKHYEQGGGRSKLFGLILLVLIALVIRALTRKE